MGTEEKNNTAERRNWSNFFCVLNRSILERQGGTGDSDMLIALRSPEHWELRALLRFFPCVVFLKKDVTSKGTTIYRAAEEGVFEKHKLKIDFPLASKFDGREALMHL
jgi:hypothetical protein